MKKILLVIFALSTFFASSLTASASEYSSQQISTSPNTNMIVDGSYVRIWENPNVEPEFELPVPKNAYGEHYESKIIDSAKTYVTTTPDGQPRFGYSMPTGGAVSINPSDGHSISVSLSTSLGNLPISIGVGYAYAGAGVASLIINIPASSNHYKVMLRHNYTVNRIEYKHYKYTELLETFYMDKPVLDSIDGFIVMVD